MFLLTVDVNVETFLQPLREVKVIVIPLSSSSNVVELSVDSFTSDLPLLAIDRAEKIDKKIEFTKYFCTKR